VFVHSVKIVEDDKRIVGRMSSIVGLELLDEGSGGGLDASYLRVVTDDVVSLPRFGKTDREGNQSLILAPILLAR